MTVTRLDSPTVAEVVASIEARRYRYATEGQLQEGIAAALRADGWRVLREASLDKFSRVDLLVGDPSDGIVVEVKVAGSRDAALRQIGRYVGYPEVAGVVLVTARVRHSTMPTVVAGKPVRVVQLALAGL